MGDGARADGALARCLRDLRDGGTVAVGADPDAAARGAEAELRELDADARARGPHGLPELDAPTALAAARVVHRILIALAYPAAGEGPDEAVPDRTQSPETLPPEIGQPETVPETVPETGPPETAMDETCAGELLDAARALQPAAIHSVDLTFAHLPQLWELARRRRAHRLVEQIDVLARVWPMSGVGVAVAADRRALRAVLGDPALRVVFCDRVHATADVAWRADPEVAAVLARAEAPAHPAPAVRDRSASGGRAADLQGDDR